MLVLASSPGSTLACFSAHVEEYGGGESGRVWSRADTNDAFRVNSCLILLDSERFVSVPT